MRPAELTDAELLATPIGSWWTFDVECFPNYFLVGFRCEATGKHVFFEAYEGHPLFIEKLVWFWPRFRLAGFNCRAYDVPMMLKAARGASAAELYETSVHIIQSEAPWWQVQDELGVSVPQFLTTVDLMEVLPLSKSVGASLKMRAAQMLHHTIQNLPFDPHTPLATAEQIAEVVRYNAVDLEVTSRLRAELAKELELREVMGRQIGENLMSKSDAQVGEAYIGAKLREITGRWPQKPKKPVLAVKYDAPPMIQFRAPALRAILEKLKTEVFQVTTSIQPAPWMADPIRIGASSYQMGTGGLHSKEESVAYVSDADNQLIDRDVASYYPAIILGQGLSPAQCGQHFQSVYREITQDRLAAKTQVKAAKAKGERNQHAEVWSDGLKISINGSIGKLQSFYSFLYSPKLLLQVTLTGQLALLMLIERLEAIGVPIVSANTDGVLMLCPHKRKAEADSVIRQWELETGFETEETLYRALYAQDVNNYIAVKSGGGTKGKGAYANPWAPGGTTQARFMKNPSALICVEAVTAFLEHRRPIVETIHACQDPARFAFVRKVKGGAYFDGQPLGKVARWYRARGRRGPLTTAAGHAVAESEGGRPMMVLPSTLPPDLDLASYVAKSEEMLTRLGHRYRRQLDFTF